MIEPMSEDFVARVQHRAADPETRTDAPPSTRGRTVTVCKLSLVGLTLGAILRGETSPTPQESPPLAPAVNDAAIADAEAALGFALPQPLRQLYAQVADGGFGPGPGILTLQQLAETYRDLTATPPGPRGQKWPAHLLPITPDDMGRDCIDINSGEMVFWDAEELAEGFSDTVWNRSFKRGEPSLAAWLERWLGSPSPEQRVREMMEQGMRKQLKQSLDHWRAMTPEQRKEYGLPETGWEQVLFGHLGIDLSSL